MSSPVDLSVVIPVHNGESFVTEAIDSALAQQGVTVEVIVVDNNSTDRTREVVKARYGSSVTLAAEAKPGAANARNAGCLLATGTYLAFLDADDVWLPGKLKKQVAACEEQPDAGIISCLCQDFHSLELDAAQRKLYVCRPDAYAYLSGSSYLSRRATFWKVGAFPEVPCGEFITWYGLAQDLGLHSVVVPEVLVRRRIHAGNSTRDRSQVAGYTLAVKALLERRRQSQTKAPLRDMGGR